MTNVLQFVLQRCIYYKVCSQHSWYWIENLVQCQPMWYILVTKMMMTKMYWKFAAKSTYLCLIFLYLISFQAEIRVYVCLISTKIIILKYHQYDSYGHCTQAISFHFNCFKSKQLFSSKLCIKPSVLCIYKYKNVLSKLTNSEW